MLIEMQGAGQNVFTCTLEENINLSGFGGHVIVTSISQEDGL